MALQPQDLREHYRNKWDYLYVIACLILFATTFYILRFNFQYKVSQYNWILVPIWALMILFATLFMYQKKFVPAAISVCVGGMAMVYLFVFLSGGIEAPGLLWLACFPLVLSMLLGPPGAIFGYVVIVLTLLSFVYCNLMNIGPNILVGYETLKTERVMNLVGFMIFASVTAHFYYRRERKMKDSLIKANNDVENLLRLLMHDIANGLSRITYDLIRHKEGVDDAPIEIEKIERAMEDINALLFQVRHLKSVKDGKSRLPTKGIPVTMALHDAFEATESTAQQKGIKISLDMSREKMWVQGDKTIFSSVILVNLLSNAIKFSHPGSIIDVRAFVRQQMVVIEIQDYGVGIPDDIMPHLFSLNAQTSRAGTMGESGTGYGMLLVKEYLQLMNGQIDVQSREVDDDSMKRGTRITLRIPLAQVETRAHI